MARRQPRTFKELAIGMVGAILSSVILYTGATHALKRMEQQTLANLANIQQSAQSKPQNPTPATPQPAQRQTDAYDSHVMKAAAESQRRHDAAWERYYQSPRGCDNWKTDQQMVECVNHRMRAKDEFERKWAAGEIDTQQG
ncbi:hypothetical protein [Pseudomonas schmalbachii]|uniref:Uncharacterized protein n=1 Tax=Pseudomonas schmalbachii TaxID=2816993 RepID=A0ABS3TXV5_9PSED|nr:hypothetical protein [Pseudomonas schmalbachii]MBO3277424.1 hypothetical protein [Pseudomonas schmalbachii]